MSKTQADVIAAAGTLLSSALIAKFTKQSASLNTALRNKTGNV
jgi:hypothetical protein